MRSSNAEQLPGISVKEAKILLNSAGTKIQKGAKMPAEVRSVQAIWESQGEKDHNKRNLMIRCFILFRISTDRYINRIDHSRDVTFSSIQRDLLRCLL